MLRTLAYKSRMGFGKHFGVTVWEMINVLKDIDYLHWSYYNMSNISFHEDILTEIGIVNRIEKPGKRPEYHLRERMYIPGLSIAEASRLKSIGRSAKKRKELQSNYKNSASKEKLCYNNRNKL